MLAKLKDKLTNTEEKKQLLSNFFYLGLLQGSNYILPLLTLPYLVRTLGAENFGLIAFSSAMMIYFTLISDYGFNLSATRQISINRDSKESVRKIFSAVMTIKLSLMIASFVLLVILLMTIPILRDYWELYLINFGVVLGQTLFPLWLFQGLEKMKYVTYLNILSKSVFALSVFVFVEDKSDLLLPPLFSSIGFILSGLISLLLVNKQLGIYYTYSSFGDLWKCLSDGWHTFISSISTSLYTATITVILGFMTNPTTVGYYAGAEKIIQAVRGLYVPVSQGIYPMISKKIHLNKAQGIAFVKKITLVVSLVMLFMSLLLYVFAHEIVMLVLGSEFLESVILLKIMSFIPLIIVLSNMFGIQMMLPLGHNKEFGRIIVAAAFIGLALSVFLIELYSDVGAALTVLITETFVTIAMLMYLKKEKIY